MSRTSTSCPPVECGSPRRPTVESVSSVQRRPVPRARVVGQRQADRAEQHQSGDREAEPHDAPREQQQLAPRQQHGRRRPVVLRVSGDRALRRGSCGRGTAARAARRGRAGAAASAARATAGARPRRARRPNAPPITNARSRPDCRRSSTKRLKPTLSYRSPRSDSSETNARLGQPPRDPFLLAQLDLLQAGVPGQQSSIMGDVVGVRRRAADRPTARAGAAVLPPERDRHPVLGY